MQVSLCCVSTTPSPLSGIKNLKQSTVQIHPLSEIQNDTHIKFLEDFSKCLKILTGPQMNPPKGNNLISYFHKHQNLVGDLKRHVSI